MGAPDQQIAAINRTPGETILLAAGRELEKHSTSAKRAPDFLHGLPFVIVKDKDGAEILTYVEKQMLHPTFRKGTVKLDDGKSFIAYVNRHVVPSTAIYAQMDPAKFVAVIDDHPGSLGRKPGDERESAGDVATAKADADLPEANWREFRAEFTPRLSAEWGVWMGQNKKPFESTDKFAYFLEDNLPDIVSPTGAELMEVALNFRVNQTVSFSSAQRLQDGHAEISYVNQVEGQAQSSTAGKIRIPEIFKIAIPVFAGVDCHLYEVDARFRYRLKGAEGLKLWYELVRPHKVMEKAFHDLWAEVGDGVERDILLGTPE